MTKLQVGLMMLAAAMLASAATFEYCARTTARSLRGIEASHQAEREDWRATDQALAAAVVAQHKLLGECRQGFADSAAAQVDTVNQIQMDTVLDALKHAAPPAELPAPPAPQPAPIGQRIMNALARLL